MEAKVLKLTCENLNHRGMGVCKADRFPIFVPGLLPGEVALVEVKDLRKTYGYGRVVSQLSLSKERTVPVCPSFGECGGCQIMHMAYPAQLEFKKKMAEETFRRIGHLELKVKDIIGMEEPYHFRNKVQVPFRDMGGEIRAGFFKQGTHEIVPLEECYIQPRTATAIVSKVKGLFEEHGLPAYDEAGHRGLLRHLLIRKTVSDEYMVVFITLEEAFPKAEGIVKALVSEFPMIKSIIQNINPKKGNAILGETSKLLYGNEYLLDEICGLRFRVSEKSFFQTNHAQTEKMYRKILSYAAPKNDEIILDGYSGVGTISLLLAREAKKVCGIEVVPEAVRDARINAELNGVKNAAFLLGKTETEIEKIKEKISTVVVDPPRKGCDAGLLEAIIARKIEKMVYVSCNVATLARDLEILSSFYEIKEITLVDMFPQTSEVEAVCLLEK